MTEDQEEAKELTDQYFELIDDGTDEDLKRNIARHLAAKAIDKVIEVISQQHRHCIG